MLDGDIFVFELLRLVLGLDEELVEALGDINALAGGSVA